MIVEKWFWSGYGAVWRLLMFVDCVWKSGDFGGKVVGFIKMIKKCLLIDVV